MQERTGKRAASDSMLLAFVKVVTTLVTISTTKLLSTGLSLEAYGAYSQVNVVTTMTTSFLLLGLVDAINYYFNNENAEFSHELRITFVNTIFAIEIALGVVTGALLCFARRWIGAYFSNDMLETLLTLVALKPMLDNLLQFYQVLFVSSGKARVIAIRNLVISLAKLVAIYVAVTCLESLASIFVLLVLLDVLQLVVMKFWYAKDVELINPFNGKLALVKPIMQFSIPMAVYALTAMLTRSVDKLIVGALVDTSTFAVYSNCSKLLPFDLLSTSFAVVLMPYIMKYVSGKDWSNAAALFRNYLKIGYYSVWILGVAVLITSKQVISFLYSDDYVPGNTIFVLYVFDSMLRFANMHLILTSAGDSTVLMKYSIVTLVLNIVLSIPFYYLFGIAGPAIATLTTAVIYSYLVLNKSRGILHAGWNEIFDLKEVGRFFSLLVLTGFIFGGVNKWMLSFGVNRFFCLFVSAGLFSIVNLLLNFKDIKSTLHTLNSLR